MDRMYDAVNNTKMGNNKKSSIGDCRGRLSDREMKVIEIALIRYADRFTMAH
jgi:hypothetical protein